MIVQEVYIGRIPEIEEMFNEFKELRDTYRVWKSGNTAKRTARIEKMIEDLWGFKAFSLSIDPSSSPNAFTYPVATSLDIDPTDYIVTDSKGYRFTKQAKVAAISKITAGLFTNKAFTDEECFAIFLHEVGHSFVHRSPYVAAQQDVYKSMMISQIIMEVIIGILTANPLQIADATSAAISSTNFYKRFIADLIKIKKKIPIIRTIDDISTAAVGTLENVIGNTIYLILSGSGINFLISAYSKSIDDSYGKKQRQLTGHPNAYARSVERLSDDFAAMYGFGPYLSSGLIKIENPDNQGLFMKITHSIPGLKTILDASDALAMEVNGLVGAHPSSANRIISLLNGMESDLANDKSMPDKVKKELKANIKQMRAVVNDIKSDTGKIKNKNEYMQALTVVGLNKSNPEDFLEKKFTDRKALKRFYDERKVRRESCIQEQAEMDLDLLMLGLDELI